MKRKSLAVIAFVLTVLFSAELSAASGSRHFGRSGRFAEHFKQSGGFRQTLGGHGFRSSWDSRRAHPRHFDGHRHFDYRKRFTPHHRFGHRPILPRHRLHSGFFSGYWFIEVPSSSIIIRSFPPSTASATPSDEGIVHGKDTLERPLITIMLRYHAELNLSPNQVQNLETLRDEFQREAIRYDADIRIAELELQKLLRAESVDLEQVKPKLQEIEHLKSELRFARLRTIQQGKALLSPEQQNRLEALLGDSRYSRVDGQNFQPAYGKLAGAN